MNTIIDIATPAVAQASTVKSDYGLESLGISHLHKAYWNLPSEALYEEVIFRNEGKVAATRGAGAAIMRWFRAATGDDA